VLENEGNNRPSRELQSEATALRRQLAEKSQILEPVTLSIWKRAVLFSLLIGTIAGAVYLLIFKESRLQLLAELTDGWMKTYSGRDADILALPPPPPKEVEPQVRYPGAFSSSGNEFDGVLYSSSSSAIGEDDKDVEEEPGFVNPAKTKESQQAFEFLTQNSEIAKKLSENSLAEYELKEWKPVRIDPPLFFIDLLVASTSESRELHLVWEVDLENSTTRPLSQAARDLEGN